MFLETLRMHHDTQESAASRLTQQLRVCHELHEDEMGWDGRSSGCDILSQVMSFCQCYVMLCYVILM